MNEGMGGVGRRSYPMRIGIAALNLITPGLGLARLGDWRHALLFLLAPFALLVFFTFGMGHLPITSYGRVLAALTIALALLAALYLVPVALTWRESKYRSPARGWSRWYGLVAIATAMIVLAQFASPLVHCFYKPFYAPSESMAPTIEKGDKFVADMRWRSPLTRGQVVVFKGPDSLRVSRIAAIAGDSIAMRHGVPVVNGVAAQQVPGGRTSFTGYDGVRSAVVLIERLPGETARHRILDSGPSEFDDTPEVMVPRGHFFVLGDNRDRSADSRAPAELGGVSMIPLDALVGRPMYIHWSGDRARIGTRLDR